MSDVRTAVVREPLDRLTGQLITEAMFDGRQHDVTHDIAGLTAGGGFPAHGLTIAAVQSKRGPHLLIIVAAKLEPIGAPPLVARWDSDTPLVATQWP